MTRKEGKLNSKLFGIQHTETVSFTVPLGFGKNTDGLMWLSELGQRKP